MVGQGRWVVLTYCEEGGRKEAGQSRRANSSQRTSPPLTCLSPCQHDADLNTLLRYLVQGLVLLGLALPRGDPARVGIVRCCERSAPAGGGRGSDEVGDRGGSHSCSNALAELVEVLLLAAGTCLQALSRASRPLAAPTLTSNGRRAQLRAPRRQRAQNSQRSPSLVTKIARLPSPVPRKVTAIVFSLRSGRCIAAVVVRGTLVWGCGRFGGSGGR